ncbi:MAG: hypothetical protein M3464_12375 [Chloroflexota bacterium]|nr:hypothetical protein [Chloroflexota bacterium]
MARRNGFAASIPRQGTLRAVSAVRSLPRDAARLANQPGGAATNRLLARRRGHWPIEHRWHRRQDMIVGEDASRVPAG